MASERLDTGFWKKSREKPHPVHWLVALDEKLGLTVKILDELRPPPPSHARFADTLTSAPVLSKTDP